MDQNTTHFGFEQIPAGEKAQRVARVFDSVAARYDLMNDLMSMGLHRVWKAVAISQANVRPGQHVLDVASGTGDLALAFAKRVGPQGRVVISDINGQMLIRGRNRLIDQGCPVESVVCDAEHLPFPDASFDLVTVAFGLRNMTDKQAALKEMARVLKPGGKCLVLEFSKVAAPLLPGMRQATAIWQSRFACIPAPKNSPRCSVVRALTSCAFRQCRPES